MSIVKCPPICLRPDGQKTCTGDRSLPFTGHGRVEGAGVTRRFAMEVPALRIGDAVSPSAEPWIGDDPFLPEVKV
jgi:hypothetical protein